MLRYARDMFTYSALVARGPNCWRVANVAFVASHQKVGQYFFSSVGRCNYNTNLFISYAPDLM